MFSIFPYDLASTGPYNPRYDLRYVLPTPPRLADAVVVTRYASAGELAAIVSKNLDNFVQDPNLRYLPFPQHTPSDHLPLHFQYRGINFVSLNALNELWIEWLTKNGEKGQRLDHLPFVKEENLGWRMDIIMSKIKRWLSDGRVVCLQEVGPELYKRIDALMSDLWACPFTYYSSRESTDKKTSAVFNRNLVLVPRILDVIVTEAEVDPVAEEETANKRVMPLVFHYRSSTSLGKRKSFILINVHLEFGDDKHATFAKWVNDYASRKGTHVVVCGDFNASNRVWNGEKHAVPRVRDHYNYPTMTLGVPNVARGLAYSHTIPYDKTDDSRGQHDLFDNVLIVAPACDVSFTATF